jgi:hypothetical protein
VHLKHLLDAANVIAGFREMLLKAEPELRIRRLFYHGGQGPQNLALTYFLGVFCGAGKHPCIGDSNQSIT